MHHSKKEIKVFFGDLPNNLVLNGDIAIDTETMGLDIRRDRLCLVQICDEDGEIYLVQIDSENKTENGWFIAPNLVKYLSDPKRKKIFHFARFDIAVLKKSFGLNKIENVFCTKISIQCLSI